MRLLIQPHNDDAVLFASWTVIRERPLVITLLDSFVQPARGNLGCWAEARREEDRRAMAILDAHIRFAGFRDDRPDWPAVEEYLGQFRDVEHVYAPAVEDGGHEHHNRIGEIAARLFAGKLTSYLTYTKAGKSTNGRRVEYDPSWVRLKLLAMSEYTSQIELPSCVPHFTRSLEEYYQI